MTVASPPPFVAWDTPTNGSYMLEVPRPERRTQDALDAFFERNLEPLEARLTAECRALGDGLGRISFLGEVIEAAVGTRGRGGRRWRPMFSLAAAEACGGRADDAMDVAVAIELTHTASLVLDDLPCMDDAEERRGQEATHRRVGSEGAILLSLGLLSRAVELLGRQPRCGGVLAAEWGRTVGIAGMSGGQAMDVAAPRPMRADERRLHRAKSSVLPGLALMGGARVSGACEAACSGLLSFGRGVGWAYQLRDDMEDWHEDAKLGRTDARISPRDLSERIMRLTYRRLELTPRLSEEGRDLLAGLASHVVPALPQRPRACDSNTGGD